MKTVVLLFQENNFMIATDSDRELGKGRRQLNRPFRKLFSSTVLVVGILGLSSLTACGSGADITVGASNTPISTPLSSPSHTVTATTEPTAEAPLALPERWNDPEVLARVQEKFESYKPLFDEILAGTLVYKNEKGEAINVRDFMKAHYSADSTSFFHSLTGDSSLGGGLIGKKGILVAHERLQYSSDIQVEVGFFALYNSSDPARLFELVPIVLGVGDVGTGQGASVGVQDIDNDEVKLAVYGSIDELGRYLDTELDGERPPMYDLTLTMVMDQTTGVRDSQAMAELMSYVLDHYSSNGQKGDAVMRAFIEGYYTDENYPAFSGVESGEDAAGWGSASQWAIEAGKTRVGLIMPVLMEMAR